MIIQNGAVKQGKLLTVFVGKFVKSVCMLCQFLNGANALKCSMFTPPSFPFYCPWNFHPNTSRSITNQTVERNEGSTNDLCSGRVRPYFSGTKKRALWVAGEPQL